MSARSTLGMVGLLGLATVAAACGGAAKAPVQQGAQAVAAGRCERRSAGKGPARVDDNREGSLVALTREGDRTFALVADEDDAVLHTVDLATGRELATTPLSGVPSQVLVAKDGRVLVAIRERNQVQVLEPAGSPSQPLDELCAIDVPTEPTGLAASPDDSAIVVTSGWGRALSVLDATSLQSRYRVPLAREARSVVISDDGSTAYVAHVVGSRMSAVDLKAPEHPVRTIDMTGSDPQINRPNKRAVAGLLKGASKGQDRMGCQSFALAKSFDPPGRIFAPQVLVDPGDPEQVTGGYGDGFRATEVSSVAVIDEAAGEAVGASLRLRANDGRVNPAGTHECLLPRAAAVDPGSHSLFVTCLGIDAVVEYDSTSADPRTAEKRRWTVPAGPLGVSVDRKGQRLVVWSQFDQALTVIPLNEETGAKPATLALSRKAKGPTEGNIALGRKIFHASGDTRIAADGRACASCHPDGRDDALTWSTPDGPRNTPMLAGRLTGTAPFSWSSNHESVPNHLGHTLSRLQGRGLAPHEVAAVEAYINTMFVPQMRVPQAGPEAERVARGKAVFESAEAACSTCHHSGSAGTDATPHDVGSKARADQADKFDTPSLRFVGGTAPYFHDGRYRTLREMLVATDGKMGHTAHLSADDIDALEAYMRSL